MVENHKRSNTSGIELGRWICFNHNSVGQLMVNIILFLLHACTQQFMWQTLRFLLQAQNHLPGRKGTWLLQSMYRGGSNLIGCPRNSLAGTGFRNMNFSFVFLAKISLLSSTRLE